MGSLADTPDLIGFFSYSVDDDEGSGGRLSKLRERIQEELRSQLGRTKRDFRLWQDKVSIQHGELWEDKIKTAIFEAAFFIPIITPTAVKSRYCRFEFETFAAREKELGRSNLIFPILYIPVPAFNDEGWRQDPLLSIIGSRQCEQWQHLRHLDPSSTEVALRVEKFCENIAKAMQQPWLSPEERREAEARRLADDERRREEKLRDQAEEERRRQEVETKRRAAEAEAAKRREDQERRRLDKQAEWAARKAQLLRPSRRSIASVGTVLALLLVAGAISLSWAYWASSPAAVTATVMQPDRQSSQNPPAKAEVQADNRAKVMPQEDKPGSQNSAAEAKGRAQGDLAKGTALEDKALADADMLADSIAKVTAQEDKQRPQNPLAQLYGPGPEAQKGEDAKKAMKELEDFMSKQALLAKTLEDVAKRRHELMKTMAAGLRTGDEHPLGLEVANMSADLRGRYKIRNTVTGVVIMGVDANSPNAGKKFSPGEAIVQFEQEAVADISDLWTKIDKVKGQGQKNALLLVASPDDKRRYVAVNIQ